MSYPPPLPISALAYDSGPRRTRPAIITAIGVMSIVVACISMLVCLWSALTSFGFLMASRLPMPTLAAATATTGPSSPTATVMVGGFAADPNDLSDGLDQARRKPVMAALESKEAMDEARLRQLDALLRVGGQKIFPSVMSGASATNLRANITDSGELPGSGGAAGPTFFIVGTGRIEVYDDHAVFRPDGSSDVISISEPAPEQIDPSAPNAAPGAPSPQASSAVVVGPTTQPAGKARRTLRPGAMFNIPPAASTSVLIEALVSFALGIYLIVAAAMVLRDSRSGARLHWIYLGIKIPLVILAAAANWWMWRALMTSVSSMTMAPPGGPPTPAMPSGIIVVWVLVIAAVALAYPIALIFVLSSRTVRAYYASVREE